jgi:PBP1b-binding outer membrane lipoprotein LpoB
MKKYISLIFIFGFLFFFQSCSSQAVLDSKTVDALVDSQEFTFHAQRANPMNYEVINVLGSIPNAPGMRMLQLDGDNYTIELKKNTLEVVLPYFGRQFNASYNTSDNGYRFTSKDFTVNKSQNKKGNWTLKIKPNDSRNVNEINIEVFKNGKAFVSMRSNDRQPITYDGYVSNNAETPKEKEKL